MSLACIVALSVVCFLFGEQREIAINNQFSDSSSAAIDIGSRFDDEFKSDFQAMDALDFVEDVVEHHVEIEDF
ncbi:MAG: hypothetical protein K6B46_06165 [Opitutales bacterium]|nr:hypothetical protein [Opitutales bacterium]